MPCLEPGARSAGSGWCCGRACGGCTVSGSAFTAGGGGGALALAAPTLPSLGAVRLDPATAGAGELSVGGSRRGVDVRAGRAAASLPAIAASARGGSAGASGAARSAMASSARCDGRSANSGGAGSSSLVRSTTPSSSSAATLDADAWLLDERITHGRATPPHPGPAMLAVGGDTPPQCRSNRRPTEPDAQRWRARVYRFLTAAHLSTEARPRLPLHASGPPLPAADAVGVLPRRAVLRTQPPACLPPQSSPTS